MGQLSVVLPRFALSLFLDPMFWLMWRRVVVWWEEDKLIKVLTVGDSTIQMDDNEADELWEL